MAAGRGGLHLIVGEAGIGKTRLADEVAARAEADGIAALWGRCWEAEGRPPYWPWVQILRELAPARGGEGSAFAPADDLPQLAQILPELRPRRDRPRGLDSRVGPLPSVRRRHDLPARARRAPRRCSWWSTTCTPPTCRRCACSQFVAHALAGVPLLALATYRDVEARQDPAVAEVLGALARRASAAAARTERRRGAVASSS